MNSTRISPFIRKLHEILKNENYSSVLRWHSKGSFEILNRKKLCDQVLKAYFKTSSFESFVRQLNKYNFKKNRNEDVFVNKDFIKDNLELLGKIQIKNTYSTLSQIREDVSTVSLFNHKVLKSLSKLVKITRKLEKSKFLSQHTQKILIFEDFDASGIMEELYKNGFDVDTVFYFNDFENKVFNRDYHYLIIDKDYYEIFIKIRGKKASRIGAKIVSTTKHRLKTEKYRVYKSINKPYDVHQILNIIKHK